MKKNFKMVVISLSFLIIGGIMVACGTKKEVTQSTTETSQDGTFSSNISGYSFELPDSFVFSNSEDTSVGFIQKDGPERNLLSINISGYTDDFDLLNERFFKELPSELWGKDSKEKSFEYYEKGDFKGAYSWYSIKKDEINMDIFNFTCADRSNCITIIYMINGKNEQEINESNETLKQIKDRFIELNY